MNIKDIKSVLGIHKLDIHQQINEDDTINPDWYQAWDEENRIRVSIPVEVFDKVNTDRLRSDLAYKKEVKTSQKSGDLYTQVYLFIPSKAPIVESW